MRPEVFAFCAGALTMFAAWMLARWMGLDRNCGVFSSDGVPPASPYHTAEIEVNSILDLLRDKFGEGWVKQSLAEFSLAATVERAIRWSRHNDEQNERMAAELKERRAYEEFLRVLVGFADTPSFESWQWYRDQENKS